jgi:broad specificity phosphatase PhoE
MKFMVKVYLLRHGETAYNADGNRYCGRTDIDLTEKGYSQANLVADQLINVQIDAVYSSPLKRAKITAEIASNGRDVKTDERLIELDFGIWEGKTKEVFIEEEPELWSNWMANPAKYKAGGNGESASEVVNRLDNFYDEILAKHAGQTIMVVAHNGVNRFLMAHKLGMPLKNYRQIVQENSAITLVEFDEKGTMTLNLLNSKI